MKRTLVAGITGQDGPYLTKLLLEKGYEIYGLHRKVSTINFWRLDYLQIRDKVKIINGDLEDLSSLEWKIEKSDPDEVYNLAAQSYVAASWKWFIYTVEVTGVGVLKILEAIGQTNPKIKFCQALSREVFRKVREIHQRETTPFYPRSPYGVSKAFECCIIINHRESFNIFAYNGILFDHKTVLRDVGFVTRKIMQGVARIKKGLQNSIELVNLDSKGEWIFAGDYVQAMWLILQQNKPDDYVIATGETHLVREFVDLAFFEEVRIDIKWKEHGLREKDIDSNIGKALIMINPEFFRSAKADLLSGDSAKAHSKLGWKPKVTFNNLQKISTGGRQYKG